MKKTLAARITDFEVGFRNPTIEVLAHLAQELDDIGLGSLSSGVDKLIGDVRDTPLFCKQAGDISAADTVILKAKVFRDWNRAFKKSNPEYPDWQHFDLASDLETIISNKVLSVESIDKSKVDENSRLVLAGDVAKFLINLIPNLVSRYISPSTQRMGEKSYLDATSVFVSELKSLQSIILAQISNAISGVEKKASADPVEQLDSSILDFINWNRSMSSSPSSFVASYAADMVKNLDIIIGEHTQSPPRTYVEAVAREVLKLSYKMYSNMVRFLNDQELVFDPVLLRSYISDFDKRLKVIYYWKSNLRNGSSPIQPSVDSSENSESHQHQVSTNAPAVELSKSERSVAPSIKEPQKERYMIDINHNGVVAPDFAIGWLRNHLNPGTYFGLMQMFSRAGPINANTTLEEAVSTKPEGTTIFTEALAQALREKWGDTPQGRQDMDSLIAGLWALNIKLIELGKSGPAQKNDIIDVLRKVEPHIMSVVQVGSPLEKAIRGEILKEFNQTNVIADSEGSVDAQQERAISGVMLPRIRARLNAIIEAAGLK